MASSTLNTTPTTAPTTPAAVFPMPSSGQVGHNAATTSRRQPGLDPLHVLITAGLIDGDATFTLDLCGYADGSLELHLPDCGDPVETTRRLDGIPATEVVTRQRGGAVGARCTAGPWHIDPGTTLHRWAPQLLLPPEALKPLEWLMNAAAIIEDLPQVLAEDLANQAGGGDAPSWVTRTLSEVRHAILLLGKRHHQDFPGPAMQALWRLAERYTADLVALEETLTASPAWYADRAAADLRGGRILDAYAADPSRVATSTRDRLTRLVVEEGLDPAAGWVWVSFHSEEHPDTSALRWAVDWCPAQLPSFAGAQMSVFVVAKVRPGALFVMDDLTVPWGLCVDRGYPADLVAQAYTMRDNLHTKDLGDLAEALAAARLP